MTVFSIRGVPGVPGVPGGRDSPEGLRPCFPKFTYSTLAYDIYGHVVQPCCSWNHRSPLPNDNAEWRSWRNHHQQVAQEPNWKITNSCILGFLNDNKVKQVGFKGAQLLNKESQGLPYASRFAPDVSLLK